MRTRQGSAAWFRRPWAFLGLLLSFWCVPAAEGAGSADAVETLAARIDAEIAAKWKESDAVPAAPASDAEFLRRVSLHLTGCIPDVATTRRFLADESPDKRRKYLEMQLDSAGYVTNFARFWRSVMLPNAGTDVQMAQFVPGFENWLRQELAAETAYDELVRQILDMENPTRDQRVFRSPIASSGSGFYLARRSMPPEVAAATARIFLGLRIDCAQCHDHPFDTWKRDQFWSLAAFFSDGTVGSGADGKAAGPMIAVPDTERTVQAAFLDDSKPEWEAGTRPRRQIAAWVTSRENPYFARAAVNRLWGHFFGRGLVDPVDDFTEANPPSHPALLNLLADEFVASDFDLKFLIRAIVSTRAYQLTSARSHGSQNDPRLFAVMPVQWLTAEQIAESYAQATGTRRSFDPLAALQRVQSSESGFESLFADDGRAGTEREATVLQALAMMNGSETTRATAFQNSRTLAAVATAPFLDTPAKVETLFLATLTRPPTAAESERLSAYVESGGPGENATSALEDIFWALLNSSEFLLNH